MTTIGHATSAMMPVGCVPTVSHDAYYQFGIPGGQMPLVFAVPHAGRDYQPSLLSLARVTPLTLARLEDRFADLLTHDLIDQGHSVLIARQPRAMIDLNRDEREIDPASISDLPRNVRPQSSAKVRGGLGLVPERVAYAGALWHRPLPYAELSRRIETVHRPYHAALGETLAAARSRHGAALLIDVHSMPPIHSSEGDVRPPNIVLGDRFGRSAADRLTDLVADLARRHGFEVAINAPYPGNHILERHGRPHQGIHAIQIEIDRALYLDRDLMTASDGVGTVRSFLSVLAGALARELTGPGLQWAAE